MINYRIKWSGDDCELVCTKLYDCECWSYFDDRLYCQSPCAVSLSHEDARILKENSNDVRWAVQHLQSESIYARVMAQYIIGNHK